ncbi:energy transducer TonB [Croceibacterium mercuriale]|nr:energy transducer TonB [Croceibacterium mercuriale]
MARDLDEGSDGVTLLITQWSPGSSFSMVLVGDPLKRFEDRQEMTLQFGDPAGLLGERRAFFAKGSLAASQDALIFRNVSLAQPTPEDAAAGDLAPEYGTAAPILPPAALAQADRIDLVQGQHSLRLRPGRLADALAVLDACSMDRLNEWGLDEAAHRTLTQSPRWTGRDLADLARQVQRGYPRAALRRGEQTDLHLRVLVDEAGTATDCTIIDTTNSSITANVCDFFRTAGAFSPALDASGRPIKSFYTSWIVYRLVRRGPN